MRRVWLPLILAMLAGCATTPAVQVRTVTVNVPVQVPIAPELLLSQPMPSWPQPRTWGSLAQYAIRLQTTALQCRAQIQAIRDTQTPPVH